MGDEQFKEREKERKRMENLMNSIELNGGVNIVRALVTLSPILSTLIIYLEFIYIWLCEFVWIIRTSNLEEKIKLL